MLVVEKEKRRQLFLDAKRRFLEERCRRIHDPKCYNCTDYHALSQQIQEKREREAEERKRDAFYDKLGQDLHNKATEVDRQIAERKRQESIELNKFRCIQQAPQTRGSFDLNDPARQKEPAPCTDDPCLSVSSAQRFVGEDLHYCERKRYQCAQLRSWLDQQIFERRAAEEQKKFANKQYQTVTDRINKCADAKEKHAHETKLKEECETRTFNLKLAEEKAKKECEEKREMLTDGGHIMYSYYLGPALTENRCVPKASSGWRRVVMDMYKGMTPQEKAAIRCKQMQEIHEQRQRRAQEAQENACWHANFQHFYQTAYMKEREEARQRAEKCRHIAEENRRMAEEQRCIRQYEDNCVHQFFPTEAYFKQFESSL